MSTHIRLTEAAVKEIKPGTKRIRVWDDEIPGFCVAITPAGRIAYYVAYRTDSSTKRWYRIGGQFRRMSAIRKEAKRIAGEVAAGRDPQAEKMQARAEDKAEKERRAQAKTNTLRAYVRDEYAPQVLDHQGKSGLETFRKLHQVWGPLLDRELTAITGADITEIVQQRRKKITIHTAARDLTTLRAVLNHAVDSERLAANPMPSRKKLLGAIPSDARVRYLEPDERARLDVALDDDATPGYLAVLVRLLLNTGMRRGEAFSLAWSDVDLPNARITLRADATKTKQQRHIPLNARTLEMMKDWHKAIGARPLPSRLVFPNPKTGRRLVTVKKAWAGLLSRAEIEDFRLHDCRHDFASRLAMAGRPILEIRELLGHTDVALTMRYSHLSPGHLRNAVEALA